MELKINEELKSVIPPLTNDEYRLLEQKLLNEGFDSEKYGKIIVCNMMLEPEEMVSNPAYGMCKEQGCNYEREYVPPKLWKPGDGVWLCPECEYGIAPYVEESTIIDGHNRYEICKKHGIAFEVKQKEFENNDAVKVWMIDNQKGRRNLTDGWKWELAQTRKALLADKGREKQSPGTNQYTDRSLSIVDNEQKHDTRKELATELGWSTGKVAMADKVWREAKPEMKEQVKSGEVSINQAYKQVSNEEKKKKRLQEIEATKAKIESEPVDISNKKYDVIAIDPPWAYEEKGGFNAQQHDSDSNRGGVDYPTMTVSEIKEITLPEKDDTVLFLWTTHSFLKDAFSILENWGYTYKATMVWDKEKMGMGRTIRLQCEFCLLATKGKPIIQGSGIRDIMREPRRQHSRKPNVFYEIVNEMCIGRKLDYFSRESREGWDEYGAEASKF